MISDALCVKPLGTPKPYKAYFEDKDQYRLMENIDNFLDAAHEKGDLFNKFR